MNYIYDMYIVTLRCDPDALIPLSDRSDEADVNADRQRVESGGLAEQKV